MVEPVRDGRSISDEPSSGIGRLRQAAIYRAGVYGRRPTIPTSWPGLEAKAQAVFVPARPGVCRWRAGLESTIHANADGFERWRIVPRVLHDVGHRYLTIELFGRVLPAPLLLGPVGVLSLAHRDADVAAARAAAAERVPMVLSNQASRSMEECVAVMGDSPRWFQLYWSTVDELVESSSLAPKPADATRSSSRLTRRCSAGDHAIWTSGRCPSRTDWASPSTPAIPSSPGWSNSGPAAVSAPGGSSDPLRRRCVHCSRLPGPTPDEPGATSGPRYHVQRSHSSTSRLFITW